MEDRARLGAGLLLVYVIFVFVQVAAVALVGPFEAAGHQPVEDPQDPTNTFLYVIAVLVATGIMLLAFRCGVDSLIRLLIVGAGAWLSVYLFELLVPSAFAVGGINVGALALAAGLGVALYAYPEWYVIDAAGAIMGAVAAGIFGITFGIMPALVLLVVLAVYDAISVYRTEHMLTLASGVMNLRVPVVLVVPTSAGYSFLEADFDGDDGPDLESGAAESNGTGDETEHETAAGTDGPDTETDAEAAASVGTDEDADSNEEEEEEEAPAPVERDALFIGLGDAVIPSVLVASAAFFVPDGVPHLLDVPIPAITAMVGTLAGLTVLLWMVLKGKPHAGLPLLNGGAITGYVGGALLSGLTIVQALGLTPYL